MNGELIYSRKRNRHDHHKIRKQQITFNSE